jgi:hypothetical protein
LGECGDHDRGHNNYTEALEGGGPRQGGLAAAQVYSGEQSRTTEGRQGENRGGVGWLPREKALGPLNGYRGTTRSWVDGGGAAAMWRKTGERGWRETEGEGANRGVSRVADIEADLTEAINTVRTRRRPQNKLETKADGGDVFFYMCTTLGGDGSSASVRVREGRGVSGGVASKGIGRVRRWSGDARSGRVHGGACEREVRETEGADRWGPCVSERGRVGGWGGADRRHPLAEGDGATGTRARAGRCRQPGSTDHRVRGGGCTRAGWAWCAERPSEGGSWAALAFPFSPKISIAFAFYFLF